MSESKIKKIRNWLEEGKPITQIMAIQMFDCLDLKSIICRLRKDGIDIKSERHGVYTRYFIEQKNEKRADNR